MLSSGIPLERSVQRKVEAFQDHYEKLLQSNYEALREIKRLDEICKHKEAEMMRTFAEYDSIVSLSQQASEENAHLRLQSLEQWEEINQLSELLDTYRAQESSKLSSNWI
ncbi:hypothetical protein BD289DRAFT_434296 [Coniella lustricola]|uniref:Uncharacterized protein n=1 Tax=Coniella lustricola TaxID=2025994 RepID=A0A2T3A7P9_9PEZI|nr:hypothetical protein BD289DRAFT_434296 [Coniella lustricola]